MRWRKRYAQRLWVTDLAVIVVVVFGTQVAWFGLGNADVQMHEDSRLSPFSYWAFSTLLIIGWMAALSLMDTRHPRVYGVGNTEYVRVARASFVVFAIIAIGSFLLKIEVARGFLLLSLPIGIIALVIARGVWRRCLVGWRRNGGYSARVLLVGSERSVADVARELRRAPYAGYHVVGACVPAGRVGTTIEGTEIPITGGVDAVTQALSDVDADTVVITSTDELPPNKVKEISWSLEAGRQHLVLAPSIADVAGPRIHAQPVAGLPLIHVETPIFTRGQRFTKRAMDLFIAVIGVIVISPLLITLAVAVRVSSPGPALFRQTRVGYRGSEFTMLKFRSMVVHAENLLPELTSQERDAGNEVLFKMKDDPRVTPLGRFMRKFSLDELPQLFNVIGGTMSIVGPRPSLPAEVELYADHVHRRFLVHPGITGLWQVSGRSTLSWEETVQLDLSYVENWSLLGDLVIVARTARAVVAPGDTAV